jgi:diguanylate cyclase (GGDEF)-like protein
VVPNGDEAVDQIAEAVSTALVLTGRDHTVLWHNRALADLLGPLAVDRLPLADAEPGGAAATATLPATADTGQRRVEVHCRPFSELLLYEVVDVTQRHTERERSDGHEWRLAHTERLAKIGTWEWCPTTGTVIWSDALLESFGFETGTKLDYATYRSLLHPDDVPMIEAALQRALRVGGSFSYAHRMYLADRTTMRHFECYGEVFSDNGDAPGRVLGVAHDVTEIRLVQDELTHLADHDPLTGLVNRRVLTAGLNRLLVGPGPGGLLIIDVDNFKDVNDLRGHAVGDEVMRCLARLLADHLPPGATLGRLGGDEFAVLLPDGGSAHALSVAERLCNAAARTPMVIFGEALRVTLSVGAASVDGEHESEVVLAHADLALYEAKNAGRNRARLFAPEQYRHAVQRVNVVRRVREALGTGRMELDAQPIVDLRTNTVTSYELLVRLRDGISPEVGPADFMPTLERGDLVRELDRWVVEQAIAALATPRARADGLCLDVNLSSRSMDDPGLGDWVVELLRRADIEPHRLGLEITETTAISNLDAARRLAMTIIAAGCRFSLDDFGAGFGSFVYLKHLPFTTVKIAGEFVRQADGQGADRVLVDAVVRVATGLGMSTVAEYVDREPLVAALRSLGVDKGQGYHLGRPAPLHRLVAEPASVLPRQPQR